MTIGSVLLFILGVVLFVVGLLVSIGLHELGHLTFAKLFNVKVTQYMLGFGRTLWSFRRGDTEYGVKPILLGGYISMVGMVAPRPSGKPAQITNTSFYGALVQDARAASADQLAESGDDERAFYRLTPWKRIIVMLAGPVTNFVIGVILFGIMFVGIGAPTSGVTSVSACLPATSQATSCSADAAASPAKQAGLRSGDAIVGIAGKSNLTTDAITRVLQKSAGERVRVRIVRDGQHRTVTVVPRAVERTVYASDGSVKHRSDGSVVTERVGAIGVSLGSVFVRQSPAVAWQAVGAQTSATAQLIVDLPQRLWSVWQAAFGHEARSTDSPQSVVGVGRTVGDVTASAGVPVQGKIWEILSLLGSLNIGLFVLNLVPLLPLDGGHVAGALWEWLKRGTARVFRRPDPGPIDLAKSMPLTLGVIGLLGCMTVLLVYADLVRPVVVG